MIWHDPEGFGMRRSAKGHAEPEFSGMAAAPLLRPPWRRLLGVFDLLAVALMRPRHNGSLGFHARLWLCLRPTSWSSTRGGWWAMLTAQPILSAAAPPRDCDDRLIGQPFWLKRFPAEFAKGKEKGGGSSCLLSRFLYLMLALSQILLLIPGVLGVS